MRPTLWAGAIAFGSLLTGLIVLIAPETNSDALIKYLPDTLSQIWPVFQAVGGAMVLYGLTLLKPQWEAAGLTLITFALGSLAVAIADYADPPVAASMLVITSLAFACAARVIVLLALAQKEQDDIRRRDDV